MGFPGTPNIPGARVRMAIADGRLGEAMDKGLREAGVVLVKTGRHPDLYDAVCGHPDILFHPIGGDKIVYAPGTDVQALEELTKAGFRLVEGKTALKCRYPGDIAYNGARVGKYFFHNLKYTDEILLKELAAAGVEPVHVRQGYAKCSVAVINENSIVTSDTGIAAAARKVNMDVLLLPPQRNIRLPGLDHGFIGGCGGLLDKDCWAVFGNAGKLDSFPEIQKFLQAKNCRILSLSDEDVTDFGSLLPILI